MKKLLLFLISLSLLTSCTKEIDSAPQMFKSATNDYKEGEVLVKYKNATQSRGGKKVRTKAMERSGYSGFYIEPATDVKKKVEDLKKDPEVEWVSPNYIMHPVYSPNDPYYTNGSLWGLGNIQVSTAWNSGNIGNQDIYVGVIDEGIKFDHPDLCGQVWTNPYDPQDGIDNDGNGYVDDKNGFDFFHHDATVFDNADNHGTHVSGTIGGIGNNGQGVVGVAPNVTIISAKFLGPQGGYLDGAIEAIDYLIDLKIRHGLKIKVVNNSWGGGGYSQGLYDAIQRGANADILFVIAAGNNGSDNDVAPFYPATYSNNNILTVASINSGDNISSFSNYGATTVDIAAPGEGIISTIATLSALYANYSGTSMAAPHVTGAAVLYFTGNPNATYTQAKNAIMASARPIPAMTGKCVTGGTLRVSSFTGNSPAAQIRSCAAFVDNEPPSTPTMSLSSVTSNTITVQWTPSTDNTSVSYYWYYYKPSSSTDYISQGTWATSYIQINLQPATSYDFYVKAVDASGNMSGPSNILTASTSGTVTPPPPPPPPSSSISASLNGSASGASHNLSWNINISGTTISEVRLEQKTGTGAFTTIYSAPLSSSGSYTNTVSQNGKYTYRLYVKGADNSSVYSNNVVLQKKGK